MTKKNVKAILSSFDEQGILNRNEYTFVEYVDQLLKFQETAARLVIGEDNANLIKLNEVVARCEALAREKNLYQNQKVIDGIRALKLINKEIAVAIAGKRGEERVTNTFQYVMRPDARFYNNVYITDGFEETELDTVVLTKNGFIILEVKNAKEDITLAPDGRILFNNSSCYHDISIGEKMDRKRRLLKYRLEKEFAEHGIDKDVRIDSLLVFSTPSGVRIRVHDQFKQESYCFRGSLFNRIDGYESEVEYSNEELAVLDEIFQKIETEQKRFMLSFDPETVKQSFAEACVELSYDSEEEKRETETSKKEIKAKSELFDQIKLAPKSAAVACLVVFSGIALGMTAKLYK